MDELERFLTLVVRELGCDDAHVEYGGRGPQPGDAGETGPRLWAPLLRGLELASPSESAPRGTWRVVATFDSGCGARWEAKQAKLRALAVAFVGLGERLEQGAPTGGGGRARQAATSQAARAELDRVLGLVAARCGAALALVLDMDSPVIWGRSDGIQDGPGAETFEAWGARAELEPELAAALASGAQAAPEHLRSESWDGAAWGAWLGVARAVAAVREEGAGDGPGFVARPFAGIYRLVLVKSELFSELAAEGVIRRALPVIERLVSNLPPVDPQPRGGRLVQLF